MVEVKEKNLVVVIPLGENPIKKEKQICFQKK